MVDQIPENDESPPKKQRHTARRIYDWLKEKHAFTGGCTTVEEYVRDARLRHKEVSVPLAHPLGDAQAGFGEVLVAIGGLEQKAHFLALLDRLTHHVYILKMNGGSLRLKTRKRKRVAERSA